MISAPISAELAKTRNHLRLVAIGLAFWAIGAIFCSAALTFRMLLLSRVIMGLGTGPFISVSAPLVGE